jgi:hypothetical protein
MIIRLNIFFSLKGILVGNPARGCLYRQPHVNDIRHDDAHRHEDRHDVYVTDKSLLKNN